MPPKPPNRPGESEATSDVRTSRRTVLTWSAGVLSAVGLSRLGAGGPTSAAARSDDGANAAASFAVRIENVSKPTTLETSANGDAGKQPIPLSPGTYAVHAEPAPMFTAGDPARDNGLETLAEDGVPTELASSLSERMGVSDSGAFDTPVGADEPGPLGPGDAYEFSVDASPGERLSFATMFVQSNDLFYAPDDEGIALFDGEDPLDGDVTIAVGLWDAGTERNEEPGLGENQAPRQSGPDTGPSEDEPVRLVTDVGDGYAYPYTSEVIRVTRTPETN
jgi:hypothetical protein